MSTGPKINWDTAHVEPGGRPGTVILVVDVQDVTDEWADAFNDRAAVRFGRPDDPRGFWGSMLYADGALVVTDLRPSDLGVLEDYLVRVWQ